MGISAKPTIDVCLVTTKSSNLQSLARMAKRNPQVNVRLWSYEGAKGFWDTIRESDLRVSTIPDIKDVPDSFLFGTAGIAMPFFDEQGLAPRKISAFDYFIADSVSGSIWKDDVIASMSRWPEVKDEAIILGSDLRQTVKGPSGAIYGRTMGSYRAKNCDIVRVLKYHMTRNTAPLILAEISRLVTMKPKMIASGRLPRVPLNASNIQHFYRCQENGYARDDLPLSIAVPEAYIWERREEQDGKFPFTVFDPDCMAARLLEKMHPSAKDPKFEERARGWIEDWPSSKASAETWIKTWSGRLRRRQAVRYKIATERSEFIGGVVASFWEPSHVRNQKIGPMTRIASAISAHLQESEKDILNEVLAFVGNSLGGFSEIEIPDQIRKDYERSKAISATMVQPEIWESGYPVANADQILQELPSAWASGASFSKKMFDAGRDSVVSMLSGGIPDPTCLVPETEIFTGPSSYPYEDMGDPVITLKVNVEGMTVQQASAEIAFARGKCAAWIILTGNGGSLAGKDVSRGAICAMAIRAAEMSVSERPSERR